MPRRVRYRVAKLLYNYESDQVNGINIIAKYKRDDVACFINTKDLIGWNIFFFGEYEKNTNSLLRKYIKAGDVIVEAGANIGSETILLSKLVGNTGVVHAFEPSPHVFERLSCNVMLNTSHSNVRIYRDALGEADKEVSFYTFPANFYNSGIGGKYADWKHSREIKVNQVTLDTWTKMNGVTKLDFLKMDIQGAELDLLKGATETLKRFKPHIFLEAHEHVPELHGLLTTAGYEVNQVTEKGLNRLKTPPAFQSDWLAVPAR